MSDYSNKHIKCFNPSTEDKSIEKKKVYHYTSPQGLYGILGNATIRFTDCQFLNDKSEYTHIRKPLFKAFDEIRSELHNDLDRSILTMLSENFEADDVRTAKEPASDADALGKRYFVFCASTAPDLLGMWNYYVKGGNYQGYNIGFKISKLLDCFSSISNPEVDVFYGLVIYKEIDQIRILKDLLLKADQALEERLEKASSGEDLHSARQEVIGEILSYIGNYRLFFKDEAFSNEKEYRFVLRLPAQIRKGTGDPMRVGFDIRNGIFTPFCDLSISKEKTIDSITLSPMLESELAKQGLSRYLRLNGYSSKIAIGQSSIPIRY